MQRRTLENNNLSQLEAGQVWKMKDECLAVKHVGRYLVEFTITKKQAKTVGHKPIRSFKQLMSISEVTKFLRNHRAVLSNA